MNNKKQKRSSLLIALSIFVMIICVAAICVFIGVFSLFPSDPQTVDEYMNKYGGNPDIYNKILSLTDCTLLQEEFDQAYANSQIQSPGTPQHKWSTGYMTAADNRMKEISCYE